MESQSASLSARGKKMLIIKKKPKKQEEEKESSDNKIPREYEILSRNVAKSILKKINKAKLAKCTSLDTPALDMYTLQNKGKESLLDFNSEITDTKNWKIRLIFILDYSPNMSSNFENYSKIVKEILVDAENYYHSCVNSIIDDATIENFLTVGLIKYNRDNQKYFISDKMFGYLELKENFFQLLNETGIKSNIDTKNGETIMQVILDGLVSLDTSDATKFGIYLMDTIKDDVVIEEATLIDLQEKNFKHNIIYMGEGSSCNFLNILSNAVTVDPIFMDG